MALIAYTNTGKTSVHIGNKTIRPGDTREVDETLVSGYKSPTAKQAPVEGELDLLLKGSVKDVLAGLEALSDHDLDALEALENAAKPPRKGVLEGALKEMLRRADLGASETADQD